MTTLQDILARAGNALQEIRGWFLNGGKSPQLAELANCMDERVKEVEEKLQRLHVTEFCGQFKDVTHEAHDKRSARYCKYDAERFLDLAIKVIEGRKSEGQDSELQACVDELKELKGMLRQFGLGAKRQLAS